MRVQPFAVATTQFLHLDRDAALLRLLLLAGVIRTTLALPPPVGRRGPRAVQIAVKLFLHDVLLARE